MMKQVLLGIAVAVFFLSCKKNQVDMASLLVHNGSYSVGDLQVLWNGSPASAVMAQGQTSGTGGIPYLALPAGVNHLVVNTGNLPLLDRNLYTEAGKNYTLLAYDTSAAKPSPAVLYMPDDLSLPDTASVKFRFLYCVPDTGAVNLVLQRRTGNDTIARAVRFIGIGTVVAAFGTTRYDTATLQVLDAVSGRQLAVVASQQLPRQGIFSFIYSGLPGGTGSAARRLSVIRHK